MITGIKDTAVRYRLYRTQGVACDDIVDAISSNISLVGKFALCTSVDSGVHGFPELGPRYGSYTGFSIQRSHLSNWPTYSGAYDEWYIFNRVRDLPIAVNALCNWGCDFLQYEDLRDCFPNSCKMDDYIIEYKPEFVIGCNDIYGYIFSIHPLASLENELRPTR